MASPALFLPGLELGPWFPDVTFRPSTAQSCPIALWSLTSSLLPRPRAPGGGPCLGPPGSLVPAHRGGLDQVLSWRLGRERVPEEAPRCWGFPLLLEGALPPPR